MENQTDFAALLVKIDKSAKDAHERLEIEENAFCVAKVLSNSLLEKLKDKNPRFRMLNDQCASMAIESAFAFVLIPIFTAAGKIADSVNATTEVVIE